MSKGHLLKNLDKKLEKEDKAAEVGYVRAEKAADEAMSKKLAEAYGANGLRRDDGSRSRGWKCDECRFINFESRLACANCLAPSASHKSREGGRAPTVAIAPTNMEPTTTLFKAAGRYYRSYCNHSTALKASAMQQAPAQKAAKPTAEHDDGDDGETEPDGTTSSPSSDVTFDRERRLFVLRVTCAEELHRVVVGSQAKTLKEIERSTGAKLIVPKPRGQGDEERRDYVTIEASALQALRLAQARVDAIAAESGEQVEYTHFLSIPLGPIPSAKATFTALFEDMKLALVNEETLVEPSLFQRPARVHITLLMLSLHTQSELSAAKIVLESLEPELQHIFGPADCVTLKNLNVMNGNPAAAHVLFMELQHDAVYQRLLALVRRINNAFIDAGIAKQRDVQSNDKLHATILNSKYRKGRPHTPFNATDALRLFGQKSFGSHKLRSIEINKLTAGSADDGFYLSETSIGFP